MRTNPRSTTNPTTHPFYDPCHVRSAVQLRHLLRNTDVLIDQGFIVADHVFVVVRAGRFNGVGGTGEKVPPQSVRDELQEWEDASGSWSGMGGG